MRKLQLSSWVQDEKKEWNFGDPLAISFSNSLPLN